MPCTNADGTSFNVLDRNLGAGSASPLDNLNSRGLYYQWGRKDPFPNFVKKILNASPLVLELIPFYPNTQISWVEPTTLLTLSEVAHYPYVFILGEKYWHSDGTARTNNDNLWGVNKTIYDPCPAGYKVAPRDTWTRVNPSNSYNTSDINGIVSAGNGWYFYNTAVGSGETSYYPYTGWMSNTTGMLNNYTTNGYSWSSELCTNNGYTDQVGVLFYNNIYGRPLDHENIRACGLPVRCVSE